MSRFFFRRPVRPLLRLRVPAILVGVVLVVLMSACGQSTVPLDLAASSGPPSGNSATPSADPVPPSGAVADTPDGSGGIDDSKNANAARTIRLRVTNATGGWLTVTYHNVVGRWRAGQEPTNGTQVDTPEIHDFNTESTNGETGAKVRYRIGTTAYYAEVTAANPLIAPNSASCKITNESGSETYTPEKSGYKCESNAGSGNDMNASFVVEPATAATQTLTNTTQVNLRDALDSLCRTDLPTFASCTADTVDNVDAALGPEHIVSPVLVNCGTATNSQSYTRSVAFSQTNTVGVTVEAQVKIAKALGANVSVTYQNSWTDTRTTEYTSVLNVPPGRYGWIAMTSQYIDVTGNFTLTAGNQTFKANRVTVAQPATDAWVKKNNKSNDVIVPRDFPMDVDQVCKGRTGKFELPEPADVLPGSSFTIAVAGSNQLAIAVPNRSHDESVALQLDRVGNAQGRNQRWTLLPVPGQADGIYQISSDNTPRLCMTFTYRSGVQPQNPDVRQIRCMPSDSPTLKQQLWTSRYNPVTGGFVFTDPNGDMLNWAGNGPAVGNLIQAMSKDPSRTSWTLSP
jgi:hypothetical protein